MAGVAQLVRASVCGSEGRGFDPRHSPHPLEVNAGNSCYQLIASLIRIWLPNLTTC